MGLPITSLYTGLSIFIALALIVWVVKGRQSEKVPLGDGGSREVMLRMRAQSNFVETALILLIALGLMEFHGMPAWFLHLFGIALVVSRTAHPIGMTNRYPQYPFRSGGTITTLLLMACAGVVLVSQFLIS